MVLGGLPAASRSRESAVRTAPDRTRRSGTVRVVDHCLVDDGGPFLGFGVSYFTALWRCKHQRERLESDLAFLQRQGFNYYRMLSMVGWYPGWAGLEIPPVSYTSRSGKKVEAWPDYWRRLAELVDLAYDRYGLRTQVTVFADAQLMPDKAARIDHMRRLLAEVVRGREHKFMLLEVANEAWQNGFPGEQGVRDLREFTEYLASRTRVPVAISSNHVGSFEELYRDSAADIATWHFSRERRADGGWKPVYDLWDYADLPGLPPVSSNEPIGPGASVAVETDEVRLVMAAAFAYAARAPMYVFHSAAGVFGKTRFEEVPAITRFRPLLRLLPGDLPNWRRNDGKEPDAPFTAFAAGRPDRYWPETEQKESGCVRNTGARQGDRFWCLPIGIGSQGLELEARRDLEVEVHHPLTGESLRKSTHRKGRRLKLEQGPGAYLIQGRLL